MILENVAGYLVAEDLGTLGVDLFIGFMPDAPAACTALYQYAGRPPAFEHDSPQPAVRYPRLQVLVRDLDYVAAMEQANEVYTALSAIVNRQLGSIRFGRIAPLQSEPFVLERDGNERVIVACNYELTI